MFSPPREVEPLAEGVRGYAERATVEGSAERWRVDRSRARMLAANASAHRPQRQKKVDALEAMLRGHEETGTPITYPSLGLEGDEAVRFARGQLAAARRELDEGDRLIHSHGCERRHRIGGRGPVMVVRSRAPRRVSGSSGRPRARRTTSATSSRDGPSDPSEPEPPRPRLTLVRRRAIYAYTVLTSIERAEAVAA